MERYSFRIVSGKSRNCVFPQNLFPKKLGEIPVFYAVIVVLNKCNNVSSSTELLRKGELYFS